MTKQEVRAQALKDVITKALNDVEVMWDDKETSHATIVGYLIGTMRVVRDNIVVDDNEVVEA